MFAFATTAVLAMATSTLAAPATAKCNPERMAAFAEVRLRGGEGDYPAPAPSSSGSPASSPALTARTVRLAACVWRLVQEERLAADVKGTFGALHSQAANSHFLPQTDEASAACLDGR